MALSLPNDPGDWQLIQRIFRQMNVTSAFQSNGIY